MNNNLKEKVCSLCYETIESGGGPAPDDDSICFLCYEYLKFEEEMLEDARRKMRKLKPVWE